MRLPARMSSPLKWVQICWRALLIQYSEAGGAIEFDAAMPHETPKSCLANVPWLSYTQFIASVS